MSDHDSSEIAEPPAEPGPEPELPPEPEAEPPPEEDPSVEEIDPDGNVTLLIEGQSRARLLVSSKILSMASPVFAGLFGPRFYEGTQMANSSCPTIPLREDDPVAMRIIIRILHYQEPEQGVSVDAETLANIAIQCDKYDCVKALNPWVFKWFSELQHITTVEEHGHLLLAAHLFRSAEQFLNVSIKAQTQLPCMFIARWQKMHMMDLLPEGVQTELAGRIDKLLGRIHAEMESVDNRLGEDRECSIMQGLLCACCGKTHPDTAKRCHQCDNSTLFGKYCTSEYRIGEYFVALRKSELRPSWERFRHASANEIASSISETRSMLRHSCQAVPCPLTIQMDMLVTRVDAIIREVKGIDLYPLHQVSVA